MALRTRKVEYVFDQRETALAASTRLDFGAKTLTITETSSRTFLSVIAEVHMSGNNTTGVTQTNWLIGIKLGSVAFDDVTVTDSLTTGGQSYHREFLRDVTSYFNTNFGSGSTQTCQVGVSFGAVITMNITVKLIITYQFDDASATTRTKTVKIPLDSKTSALTTTLAEIGTNQVPALDTFLPEASKAYKQVWFEIMGNDGLNGTTDSNLAASLDAEALEHAFGLQECQLNFGRLVRHHWIRDDMTTNATHAFNLRVSNTVLKYACVSIVLCVTYTYDHSSSTTILNSLEIPMHVKSDVPGAWTSSDILTALMDVYIEEPATITLVQSGVRIGIGCVSNGQVLNVQFGSQAAFRAYTLSYNSSGDVTYLTHRIDSSGAGGAAFTIARNLNRLTCQLYGSTTSDPPGGDLSVMLFLNYTSGKHSSGDGVHNHTIVQHVNSLGLQNAGTSSIDISQSSSVAPAIPETSYYLNSLGFYFSCTTDYTPTGFNFLMEEVSDDDSGIESWRSLWSGPYWSESSDPWPSLWFDATRHFNGLYCLPSELLILGNARRYRHVSRQGGRFNSYMFITYHAIAFKMEGTVSGYTGTGASLTVTAHRVSDGRKVGAGVTVLGGAYSITIYDDTSNGYYVEVQQDATHVGRSANGTPTAA